MTFTEARNEFDSKYQFIKKYTCFRPEHLTMNKESKVRKKNGEHNSLSNYNYNTVNFTLDNFLVLDNAYNEDAGIHELDKTTKMLKSILNSAIDNIANDKEVTINFSK